MIYSSNWSKSAYNFYTSKYATIADYPGINYLLQTIVFFAKIGIISIMSGFKNSKLNILCIIIIHLNIKFDGKVIESPEFLMILIDNKSDP